MDRAVYSQTGSIYAGTGVQSLHLCIPPAELLRVSGATVGDFTLELSSEVSAPLPPAELPDDNVILEETPFEDLSSPSPLPIDNAVLEATAYEYLSFRAGELTTSEATSDPVAWMHLHSLGRSRECWPQRA